jgi:hypothetical protein
MDKLFSQRAWAKQKQIAKLQAQRDKLVIALKVPGTHLNFTRHQLKVIDGMIRTLLDEK